MKWIKATEESLNNNQVVRKISNKKLLIGYEFNEMELFKRSSLGGKKDIIPFTDVEVLDESTPKEVGPDKKRIDEYDGRNPQTLYTYYEVELVNMPVDWDTTICESLDEVRGVLQYVDIHLDDDTALEDGQKRQVIVTGIPMTPYAFLKWAQDNYPEKYESMVTGSQSPYHNNTKEVEQRTDKIENLADQYTMAICGSDKHTDHSKVVYGYLIDFASKIKNKDGETESESYWRNRCEKAEYELFKMTHTVCDTCGMPGEPGACLKVGDNRPCGGEVPEAAK